MNYLLTKILKEVRLEGKLIWSDLVSVIDNLFTDYEPVNSLEYE